MADKCEQALQSLHALEEEKAAEAEDSYQEAAAWLREAVKSILGKVKLLPKEKQSKAVKQPGKAPAPQRKARGKRAPPAALETVMEEEEGEEEVAAADKLHGDGREDPAEQVASTKAGRALRSKAREPANAPARATRSRVAAKTATLAESFPSPPKARRTRAKKQKRESQLPNISENNGVKSPTHQSPEKPCVESAAEVEKSRREESGSLGRPISSDMLEPASNTDHQIEPAQPSPGGQVDDEADIAAAELREEVPDGLLQDVVAQQSGGHMLEKDDNTQGREESWVDTASDVAQAGVQETGDQTIRDSGGAAADELLSAQFTPAQALAKTGLPSLSAPTTRSRAKEAAHTRLLGSRGTPAGGQSHTAHPTAASQLGKSHLHQNALYDSQFMTPTVSATALQPRQDGHDQLEALQQPPVMPEDMPAPISKSAASLSEERLAQSQSQVHQMQEQSPDLQYHDAESDVAAVEHQEPPDRQSSREQAVATGFQDVKLSSSPSAPGQESRQSREAAAKTAGPLDENADGPAAEASLQEPHIEAVPEDMEAQAGDDSVGLDEDALGTGQVAVDSAGQATLQAHPAPQNPGQQRPLQASSQNLVTTHRSLLPTKTQPQTTFAAGKKAGEVDALKAAEAAKRKEAAREAARQQQKEALRKQKAERMKHAQQVKANHEEGQRKAAEEASRREEAAKRKEEEAAARRRAREELEKREKEEKQRKIEEAKLKRRQEDLKKQEDASKKRAREAELKQPNRPPPQEQNENKRPKVAEYFAKAAALIAPQKSVLQPQGAVPDNSLQPLPAQQLRAPQPDASQAAQSHRQPLQAALPVPAGLESIEIAPYKSEGETSDEDDDQEIPAWAQAGNLRRQIVAQQHLDPDELFQQREKTCPLNEVFSSIRGQEEAKRDLTRRTSTGNWLNDRVTWKEELNYKKAMGYL